MARMVTQLTHRRVLEIQGEDKAVFLQGLISNDIHNVKPDQAIYSTFLTSQGRFLYDFFIIEKDESYLLDLEASQVEAFLKKLSFYKLRSRVNFKSRPDMKIFAMWGHDVAGALELKEERGNAHAGFFMDPRLLELGARAIGEVVSKDFQPSTLQDYDLHRLRLGVPEGGKDLIPEKSILLESGLDELNAISWTKGCYMGQELTARTKYRGHVRKRLFPVKIEGELPADSKEILLNETIVGEMRTHSGAHGLAFLRLDAFETYERGEGKLRCGNSSLNPYKLFWMRFEEPS